MIYEEKEFTVKDGTKVTVRTPSKDDAADLLDFIKTICGQTDFLLSSPEDFNRSVESEAEFIETMRTGRDWLLVACVGGKIIGDCSLAFNRHLKDRHRSSVGIGIDREYWNRGIGSLFFDILIDIAKNTKGIEQMELGVIDKNERAKHLYEKKGFVKTGSIPHALKLKDGTYFDEEMMTKFL